MNLRFFIGVSIACIALAAPATGQLTPDAMAQSAAASGETASPSSLQLAGISGTVNDSESGVIPGAQVVLSGPTAADQQTATANDSGGFAFENLRPGVPYRVTISANGFVSWTSPEIVLNAGQYQILTGAKLEIAGGSTSVTVSAKSSDIQLATEQLHMEEQQRVLGVVPNFYVVYDHNAAPLTTKLKFELAWKEEANPITILGEGFVAGLDQTGATPDYTEGAKGYFERFGAVYTDGFTDIMFGGAILPSLLHQDPRYFYKGEGTTRSRVLYALENSFICKGDNGRWEPNYSSIGGDLISGAISNAYYPRTNRGASLVFVNAGLTTGGRMVDDVVQEFLLKRFTTGSRNHAN